MTQVYFLFLNSFIVQPKTSIEKYERYHSNTNLKDTKPNYAVKKNYLKDTNLKDTNIQYLLSEDVLSCAGSTKLFQRFQNYLKSSFI